MTIGKEIVFVVDDDDAVRGSLKFSLEIEGLTVRLCAGGAELLAHPELDCARCIVLDYKMPSMDGFDVLDELAIAKVQVPIILITVYATPALYRRAKAAGVVRVLEKPLFNGGLLESIHHVLGTSPASSTA
ncbi:response regulator [Acidisphaera sp. L21]|uniref:response regulator n=1 Tax=Acidisphaera sp. L21 TaxID=1641851 RepID=UPI00131ACFC0|nr:response regulator [Acidisphaera sp. L21]